MESVLTNVQMGFTVTKNERNACHVPSVVTFAILLDVLIAHKTGLKQKRDDVCCDLATIAMNVRSYKAMNLTPFIS